MSVVFILFQFVLVILVLKVKLNEDEKCWNKKTSWNKISLSFFLFVFSLNLKFNLLQVFFMALVLVNYNNPGSYYITSQLLRPNSPTYTMP